MAMADFLPPPPIIGSFFSLVGSLFHFTISNREQEILNWSLCMVESSWHAFYVLHLVCNLPWEDYAKRVDGTLGEQEEVCKGLFC